MIVAVDSKDNVYVSDQTLPRVQKFDSDGNIIKMWGKEGNDKDGFVHQHDITVDSKDYVYVTDGRENSRVLVFDSDGNFKVWGSEGKDEGEFIENHGIVVDSEGNVYVVDTRNVRVQKFDFYGNFSYNLGCKDNQFLIPHDIAIDSEVTYMLQTVEITL